MILCYFFPCKSHNPYPTVNIKKVIINKKSTKAVSIDLSLIYITMLSNIVTTNIPVQYCTISLLEIFYSTDYENIACLFKCSVKKLPWQKVIKNIRRANE